LPAASRRDETASLERTDGHRFPAAGSPDCLRWGGSLLCCYGLQRFASGLGWRSSAESELAGSVLAASANAVVAPAFAGWRSGSWLRGGPSGSAPPGSRDLIELSGRECPRARRLVGLPGARVTSFDTAVVRRVEGVAEAAREVSSLPRALPAYGASP